MFVVEAVVSRAVVLLLRFLLFVLCSSFSSSFSLSVSRLCVVCVFAAGVRLAFVAASPLVPFCRCFWRGLVGVVVVLSSSSGGQFRRVAVSVYSFRHLGFAWCSSAFAVAGVVVLAVVRSCRFSPSASNTVLLFGDCRCHFREPVQHSLVFVLAFFSAVVGQWLVLLVVFSFSTAACRRARCQLRRCRGIRRQQRRPSPAYQWFVEQIEQLGLLRAQLRCRRSGSLLAVDLTPANCVAVRIKEELWSSWVASGCGSA